MIEENKTNEIKCFLKEQDHNSSLQFLKYYFHKYWWEIFSYAFLRSLSLSIYINISIYICLSIDLLKLVDDAFFII